MTAADRPVARTRTPRAAADENVDPVANTAPPANTPATAPPAGGGMPPQPYGRPLVSRQRGVRGAPESTVQLNSRVSGEVAELVDDVIDQTGWTKRSVIEHALRSTYQGASKL